MLISTQEDLRNFLIEYFKKRGKSVRVILFGSRARQDYKPYSDIDLAIISDEDLNEEILELKDFIEESDIAQKIDIVLFKKLSSRMKEEIMKEGKVWIDLKH